MVILTLALLTGCGGAANGPDRDGAAAPEAPRSSKAVTAERVKSALEARLTPNEARFGSGTGSPCSTSSARMFAAECGDAAKVTGADASFALEQIEGRQGFATLRAVAVELRAAVASYQRLGCADHPAATATRHACLAPAAVIAQGFPDLRDGADLGLRGA
ncbi:hypothetical protein [Streptomyces sp. MI02-7b]|uniref:hypothetical protein n=1 Tax=Streptomyces sp. MI02-7b TaxID=462941 RepID=UPI0029A6BF89|nr:hypothetical protein [Streptomyces sp. MI02-7b]MDX3077737.1 hypothetical protein [Streptomyces sp. MI02-7b]